jgi:hypothetical protein
MVFFITVQGLLAETRAAFESHFAVQSASDIEALSIVQNDLDWSDACLFHAAVDTPRNDELFRGLATGRWIRL